MCIHKIDDYSVTPSGFYIGAKPYSIIITPLRGCYTVIYKHQKSRRDDMITQNKNKLLYYNDTPSGLSYNDI